MGLRFRKSFSFGKFFKINISKSGIGYSIGAKGARLTKKSGGGTRSTLSIPGTGISYVHDSKSRKKRSSAHNVTARSEVNGTLIECEDEASESFSSCELKHVINKFKSVLLLPKIFMILASISLVAFVLLSRSTVSNVIKIVMLAVTVVLWALYVLLHYTYRVHLEYVIEDDCLEDTQGLQNKIRQFCDNAGVWIVDSIQLSEKKGKETASLSRQRVILSDKPVSPIKTNGKCLTLQVGKRSYLFLPDMLMIIAGVKCTAISYNDLQCKLGTKQIEEIMPVTSGVKVLGKTWQVVTKSGERDRRYSDNKQVAICEYGLMYLHSEAGFELNILSTNTSCKESL